MNKSKGIRIWIVIALMHSLSACAGVSMADSNYIQKTAVLKNDAGYAASVLRYRADGKHLAVTGSSNPYIYIYDLDSKKRIHKLDKRTKKFGTEMSYDGSGRYLISEWTGPQNDGGYFLVWDAENNYQLISDSIKHTARGDYFYPAPGNKMITSVDFSNKGKTSGLAKLWIISPPKMSIQTFWHDVPGSETIAISPDGKYLVDVEHDLMNRENDIDDQYHLRVWTYPDISFIQKLKTPHITVVNALAWSWDASKFLTSGWIYDAEELKKKEGRVYTQKIKLWDAENWKLTREFDIGLGVSEAMFFLPDNDHVFILTGDRRLQLWDSRLGKMIAENRVSDTQFIFTLAQNPKKRDQFAFGYEDEVWLYEINPPTH